MIQLKTRLARWPAATPSHVARATAALSDKRGVSIQQWAARALLVPGKTIRCVLSSGPHQDRGAKTRHRSALHLDRAKQREEGNNLQLLRRSATSEDIR